MFYIFALFSVFIDNRSLYSSFGFHSQRPIIIGFILFSDALAPMTRATAGASLAAC